MASPPNRLQKIAAVLVRAIVPCGILAAGWLGFVELSEETVKPPAPAEEKRMLRTRVQQMETVDYPVTVRTHAVVQPHNRVTLTSEISGTVVKVSPSFEAGAYFRKGDVLVEIDERDYQTALAIAKSRLAAADSALKLARLNEERKLRLVESNAVSRAEVDVASATREQAEADLELAKTEVEQAKLNLARTEIHAPFDGRVQSKLIGIGQTASSNAPLGEVFAVDFAEVRLPISGQQRRYLTLPEFPDDPPVSVELRDAINEGNETVWHAQIVRTEGVLDADSRDLFVIARIDDPFGRTSGMPPLRIGQPVSADVQGQVLNNVVALPRAAVKQLDQVVLVNQSDLTLRSLSIAPLWSNEEHVVVEATAIPDHTWLSTTPMSYTPEGAKIEIIPDANPDANAAIAESASNDDETLAN